MDKGNLLCIIDFLNIPIEVKFPIDGIPGDICVKNKTFVDYGKKLFLITY